MPQVRKQQYTRPIPEGATRTKMTIRRRGKDIEVPAVRFKGTDGRMMTAPVVQSGKGAGVAYRAESEHYYGTVKGKPVKLLTNKTASEMRLAELIRERERGEVGIADPHLAHRKRPLSEHIDDFEQALAARGSGADHVEQAAARVRRALIGGCGFVRLGDIDPSKVTKWLRSQQEAAEVVEIPSDRELFTIQDIAAMVGLRDFSVAALLKGLGHASGRKGKRLRVGREAVLALLEKRGRGVSDATANHYRVSLRSFGRWLSREAKRLPTNPFGDLGKIPVLEQRHARRELPTDQIRLLLATTAVSTRVFRRLDGPTRSILYATASGTGFRAGGLARLTPECFRLDDARPTITLPVRGDKSKRGKVQPIPADLAAALRIFLEGKPGGKPVWPGTWSKEGTAADMLRGDLAEAGIPAVLEGPNGPEYCDFHSLRHSYLTALGRSGVDLRVQQELAGHSSPLITVRYSHVRLHDLAGAVDKLPATIGMSHPAPAAKGGEGEGVAYVPLTFGADAGGGLARTPDGEATPRPDSQPRRKSSRANAIDGGRGLAIASGGENGNGGKSVAG
jgi:integrase/recombinase XerC